MGNVVIPSCYAKPVLWINGDATAILPGAGVVGPSGKDGGIAACTPTCNHVALVTHWLLCREKLAVLTMRRVQVLAGIGREVE